jgi:hypothetical protein
MLADQTRTAEASGRGAGHFLALSLRDALKAGELCRVTQHPSSVPGRRWYDLRFHWPSTDRGEAIRVATTERGQVLIAETWLLPLVSDSILFGPLPDLCRELEEAHSIVALRPLSSSGERGILALALESDTGKQLLLTQPTAKTAGPP